jgi:hypothetical protein
VQRFSIPGARIKDSLDHKRAGATNFYALRFLRQIHAAWYFCNICFERLESLDCFHKLTQCFAVE